MVTEKFNEKRAARQRHDARTVMRQRLLRDDKSAEAVRRGNEGDEGKEEESP